MNDDTYLSFVVIYLNKNKKKKQLFAINQVHPLRKHAPNVKIQIYVMYNV